FPRLYLKLQRVPSTQGQVPRDRHSVAVRAAKDQGRGGGGAEAGVATPVHALVPQHQPQAHLVQGVIKSWLLIDVLKKKGNAGIKSVPSLGVSASHLPVSQCARVSVPMSQCARVSVPVSQCARVSVALSQCARVSVPVSQCARVSVALSQCARVSVPVSQCASVSVALSQCARVSLGPRLCAPPQSSPVRNRVAPDLSRETPLRKERVGAEYTAHTAKMGQPLSTAGLKYRSGTF
uniref:Uncharacterized protein n=1 Tax=Paramormyrops kingsleyae TaxID=1676925 RepID=A0A3B3TAR4_9TELE